MLAAEVLLGRLVLLERQTEAEVVVASADLLAAESHLLAHLEEIEVRLLLQFLAGLLLAAGEETALP